MSILRASFLGSLLLLVLALSGSGAGTGPQSIADGAARAVIITTNVLADGHVQGSYEGILTARGGNPPYRWRVTSGKLPPGLKLSQGSGRIAGAPTAPGQFIFTVEAADSSKLPQLTASKTFTLSVLSIRFDEYGGLLDVGAPTRGSGYFRVEKFRKRWMFVTPAGNAFWMFGVYAVTPADAIDDLGSSYKSRVIAKYGDADLKWGPQQNRRLRAWGFNTLGIYSSRYTLPTTSEPAHWPGGTQPVKMPFIAIVRPSLYCLRNLNKWAREPVKDIVYGTDSHYTGWRSSFPDIFDPNFDMWLKNALLNDPAYREIRSSLNLSYMVGMVSDELDNLNGFGAGSDFATEPPGYNNRHMGWVVLVTSPAQTSNSSLRVIYADPKVYTKLALRDFLAAKYETIDKLNAAWGSIYSTFDSDGGWPDGKGLLDENGRHSWIGKDYVHLSDANPNLKTDLDEFLFELAKRYFSICRTRIKQYFPNNLYLGVDMIGSWRTPARKQVLQAASQYVDVLVTNHNGDQNRLDFTARCFGDKPIVSWEGSTANPDSDLWRYPQAAGPLIFRSQEERGNFLVNVLHAYVSQSVSATRTIPIAGVILWQYTDNWGEKANWGLVSLSDNAYDGKEARKAPGNDPWGYPTGGEERDYSDALTPIKKAILSILQSLVEEHKTQSRH